MNINLKIEKEIAVVEFDQPESKVNVLNIPTMSEFKDVLLKLKEDKNIKAIFITSKKDGIFIAGADIKEIENITNTGEAKEKSKEGQDILNILEQMQCPTFALINGVCLGGGLELVLSCDYRLATFSDKVKLGLPEVKLGIIPGFGGTKRLPDLVGLQKGIELILAGRVLSAKESLKIKLVDTLVPESRLIEDALEFFEKHKNKRITKKTKPKGLINKLLENNPIGRKLVFALARKSTIGKTKGQYPAPIVALDVIVKNHNSSLSESLEKERNSFADLAITNVSKNLIKVFYLTEKYKKQKWTEGIAMDIHKCGVLGAGVMGGGISQLISSTNVPVRMKDMNYAALASGIKAAKKVFDYAVKKKRTTKADSIFKMGLISYTTEYAGFKNTDFIIEAVVEDINIKKKVFVEIGKIAKNAVLATNTSALSIDEIASDAIEPSRVVGMHFFNPVHLMPLVEVVKGKRTSEETLATTVDFSRKLGKTVIVVKDSCGFLINRILIPYLNEAGFILETGVAFETIDKIATDFGMPMGPFELVDEIGLDVGYKVAKILEKGFADRMQVSPVLNKIYENKLFGKKTGKGFYVHKKKEKTINEEIYSILNVQKREASPTEEILQRLVYVMINEASRCLEDGVCNEPSDVDIGMIMGTGFPPFRGGLLRYADSIGLGTIADKLEKFYKVYGKKFEPSEYLLKLISSNKKFYNGG